MRPCRRGWARGRRGGAAFDAYGSTNLQALYRDDYGFPSRDYYLIGFRVSATPEPATLALLALGGLAIPRRRRGK